MVVKCNVDIISKKDINEMPNAWTNRDYFCILKELGYQEDLEDTGIKEMVLMALCDQEPTESAKLLLNYRLKKVLTKAQIQKLAHDMQQVKVWEEYPDIFIQQELFNINQLLFESYKGRFPLCKAIELTMTLQVNPIEYMKNNNWINEIIIKALSSELRDPSPIIRLYKTEMNGKKRFRTASGILWKTEISKFMDECFDIRIYSSEYWLHDLRVSIPYETTIEVID